MHSLRIIKNLDKLKTIDLVCRGGLSPKVFRFYLDWISICSQIEGF